MLLRSRNTGNLVQKQTSEDLKIAKGIDSLADEVESIKKLLILFLLKMGSTSEEIGTALDVDSSAIRRMIPSSDIKKFQFVSTNSKVGRNITRAK